MRRKYVFAAVGVMVVAVVVAAMWSKRKPPVQFGCVDDTLQVVAADDRFMAGVLEPGKTYEVLVGFYKCNPPENGDLVLYRFSQMADPVIKIVRGSPGDKFELVPDKQHQAWNLLINGDPVTHDEKPYFFGGRNKPTLGLYEKERNNTLGPGEFILLSKIPPGGDDSGMFGLVNQSDIVGKVKLP